MNNLQSKDILRGKSASECFFQMLRLAIGVSDESPKVLSLEEWMRLYKMAQQQSLLGVLFYGIEQYSEIRPPRELLLKWYAVSEQIRRANERTNRVAVKVCERFRKKGFRTCVLKGQGNTLNYPDPYVRASGDIDVWVEGGEEKVLAFARGIVGETKICYHHVDFKAVDGVEVEVHYRPSFMNNLIHNRRLQRWFEGQADEQFSYEVELPDGAGRNCVPTHAFNRIYQLAHINQHVINGGIGLRQIVDYYFVLKQGFSEEERQTDGKLLRRLGLYDVAAAVMYVLKEILLMEESMLLVPADERSGKFLLDEILIGGNFGQYDKRVRHNVSQLSQNIQRLKRDFRLMWYFPSECLWEPIFRVYHFFWRLLNSLALRVEGAASRRRKNVKK